MQEIKREGTLKKTLTSLEFHIQQFFILQGLKMLLSGLAYDKVYYVTDWTKNNVSSLLGTYKNCTLQRNFS